MSVMTTTVAFPAPERGSLGSVVGSNVRALMAARGVSQIQMASILGVTQSAVSKRLRGVTPFDTRDLQAISEAFGIHAMNLLDERFAPAAARQPVVTVGYFTQAFRNSRASRRERRRTGPQLVPAAA